MLIAIFIVICIIMLTAFAILNHIIALNDNLVKFTRIYHALKSKE